MKKATQKKCSLIQVSLHSTIIGKENFIRFRSESSKNSWFHNNFSSAELLLFETQILSVEEKSWATTFSQCKQKTEMSHQKTPHLFINCQKNPLKVLYQVSHWDTFSWWHVNKTLTLSHHHQSFEKNFGVKANKNVVSRLPETACWQYWIQSITTFYRTLTHHYLWDNSIMLRNCWDGTMRYYITSMKMILSAPLFNMRSYSLKCECGQKAKPGEFL